MSVLLVLFSLLSVYSIESFECVPLFQSILEICESWTSLSARWSTESYDFLILIQPVLKFCLYLWLAYMKNRAIYKQIIHLPPHSFLAPLWSFCTRLFLSTVSVHWVEKAGGNHWCFPLCQFRSKRINGTVRHRWKFYGQSGPPPEVVLFDSRSGPSENCRSIFRNFCFQSCSSSIVTTVKMADGSNVSVYECSVCKRQTQDVNFLLMHSCTQGSGTAEHLNLFFLVVFVSF